MKTWNAKANEVERKWWVVDATDKNVGRIATEIALILRGKNKPQFTPHMDTGDFVVVVNAEKVKLTGDKWNSRKYRRHSRYFGSLKELSAAQMLKKDSAEIITSAVKGMLPKNKLSDRLIMKLKAYEGGTHPHQAQNPISLNL